MTMTLWQITGTVNGRQLPTFYLDKQVQGIMDNKQAEKIARDIITVNGFITYSEINLSVMAIDYTI